MMAPVPTPNREVVMRFLATAVGRDIHLAAIAEGGPPVCGWFGDDITKATDWAMAQNSAGRGVYWTVNCTRSQLSRKPSKNDISEARYLHVDVDPPFDRERTLEALRTAQAPPSLIVDSGNGLQAFWGLEEASTDLKTVEELNSRLITAYCGDSGTYNVDRLMRLPGTVNFPSDKKRQAGRVPVLAAIIEEDTGRRHSLAELSAWLPVSPKATLAATALVPRQYGLRTLQDLKIEPGSRLHALITAPPKQDRSAAVFACACEMRRAGYADEQIGGILLNPEYPISAHCREQADPQRSVHRALSASEEAVAKLGGVGLDDFCAYMPAHQYPFIPSGDLWPAASVNARLGPVQLTSADGRALLDENGNPQFVSASRWLDKERAVEQMTWAPGYPMLIRDRLASGGNWVERPGVSCLNLYRPPVLQDGDPNAASKWLEHVHRLYSESDTGHIINWLAHRIQRPQEKINHALVLGGSQGIGKDTLLEPIKIGVGPSNFAEVSPQQMLGRFNGFLKSVVLRISEARDLGDTDRFKFYDHLKTITAAPPDVLRVDEKHVREYPILNVCGVIITTNHRTDGIFLPPDDRRHFVAWSPLMKEDFTEQYWNDLWTWFADGGIHNVIAYLRGLDLSGFDAKAPPPKTEAFRAIVDANRAPEDAEVADALEKLDDPPAVTLQMLKWHADWGFSSWLGDRKNSRRIPHRLEANGYEPARNPTAQDGLWKLPEGRAVIYARSELSLNERISAARTLLANPPSPPSESWGDLSAA